MAINRRQFLTMFGLTGLTGLAGLVYSKVFRKPRPVAVVTPAFVKNDAPAEKLLAVSGSDLLCRFVSVADTGSGSPDQFSVARAMDKYHDTDPYSMVVLAGDNVYPAGDMQFVGDKFEKPYKMLLDKKVEFRASLGNHDVRFKNGDEQVKYAPFNMGGRNYTFEHGGIEFFVLDTNINATFDAQLPWLDAELTRSKAVTKIVTGHHQMYASGHYGPNVKLIACLTPIFKKHGVKLYINGHEHHYERTHCIEGTTYITCGAGGAALRAADAKNWSAIVKPHFSFVAYELYGKKDSSGPRSLKIKAIDAENQIMDESIITI